MILSFTESVQEYFHKLGNASFVDFIPFIIGIVIGFALCFLIYLLVFVISIKKDSKNISDSETNEISDEEIRIIIENCKNKYKEEVSSKKTSEKLTDLKSMSWDLINDIARTYYPNSQYPLFELSIEELISLDYYIMKRIEKIFSGKVLSKVKKMKIYSIDHLIDMKKKYEDAIQAQKDVTFESKVTESNLDSTAVNKLNAFAKSSGSKAVSTFDITLSMLIDGKDEGNITETSAPLTFNIPIPQELKKAGRKFYVLRYHDGKVDQLPVDDNGNFTTDKFSMYMLVYEDVATPTTSETKPEVKPNTGTTTTTTDTKKNNTVKKDVKKNTKVNTSTKTSSTLFTGLLGVSIVGLGAVEVLRRRNK